MDLLGGRSPSESRSCARLYLRLRRHTRRTSPDVACVWAAIAIGLYSQRRRRLPSEPRHYAQLFVGDDAPDLQEIDIPVFLLTREDAFLLSTQKTSDSDSPTDVGIRLTAVSALPERETFGILFPLVYYESGGGWESLSPLRQTASGVGGLYVKYRDMLDENNVTSVDPLLAYDEKSSYASLPAQPHLSVRTSL